MQTQRRPKADLSANRRRMRKLQDELAVRSMCAEWSKDLAAAKQAYAETADEETKTRLREVMAEHHHRRRWLRQAAQARNIQDALAQMPADDPRRAQLADRLARLVEATGIASTEVADAVPPRDGRAARPRTIQAKARVADGRGA